MLAGMLWLRVPVRDENCASWLRILAARANPPLDIREQAGHLLEAKLREEAARLNLGDLLEPETAA